MLRYRFLCSRTSRLSKDSPFSPEPPHPLPVPSHGKGTGHFQPNLVPPPKSADPVIALSASALNGLLTGLAVSLAKLMNQEIPEATLAPVVEALVSNTLQTPDQTPPTPQPQPEEGADSPLPPQGMEISVEAPSETALPQPLAASPALEGSALHSGTSRESEANATCSRRQQEGTLSISSSSKKHSLPSPSPPNSEDTPLTASPGLGEAHRAPASS